VLAEIGEAASAGKKRDIDAAFLSRAALKLPITPAPTIRTFIVITPRDDVGGERR
jgi:hypothetical protein